MGLRGLTDEVSHEENFASQQPEQNGAHVSAVFE
jgi:hypothetical protein